jgi:hypothetical protein
VRSGPGEGRTILLLYIISARPSKHPLMVLTVLKVYMELGSYFVSARTIKRHHHTSPIPVTAVIRVFYSPSGPCGAQRTAAAGLRV